MSHPFTTRTRWATPSTQGSDRWTRARITSDHDRPTRVVRAGQREWYTNSAADRAELAMVLAYRDR